MKERTTPFQVATAKYQTEYEPLEDEVRVRLLNGPRWLHETTIKASAYQVAQPYSSWYPYLVLTGAEPYDFCQSFEFLFELVEQGFAFAGRYVFKDKDLAGLQRYQERLSASSLPYQFQLSPDHSAPVLYFWTVNCLADVYEFEDIWTIVSHLKAQTNHHALWPMTRERLERYWKEPLVHLMRPLLSDPPLELNPSEMLFLMKLISGESLETYLIP